VGSGVLVTSLSTTTVCSMTWAVGSGPAVFGTLVACGAGVAVATGVGPIAIGSDADLVIWNPDHQFKVAATSLHHRHKITPYNGETLSGVIQQTFLRGRKIYDGGNFVSLPLGHMLLKEH
jgi:dihydroorotase-like cyclic amidohydrolase